MKEGKKPEYPETTPDNKIQKMPHTNALKFKPQARLELALYHWWQVRKADVLNIILHVTPGLSDTTGPRALYRCKAVLLFYIVCNDNHHHHHHRKVQFEIFYNLLTALPTVSNTYAQVAWAQSCVNHMQHIEHLSHATCRVMCHVVQSNSSAIKFDRV